MDQTGFIAGVELGTSKIVGHIGRKNEQGIITILASETIPSDSCVKYGTIYNIEEAAGKIKKMINLLENKSGKKVGQIYATIGGRSLRAVEHTEVRDFGEPTSVTIDILDKMEQQAKLNRPEFYTNYSVLAPEYYLDGHREEDPLGKEASVIEMKCLLVIGRPNIKHNLSKAITDKNHIDIAGFVVGPVAAGALVVEEADRMGGCALIDFGAGTTTLSIYKDGLLRYISVIPFGGRTITKDIQELGFVYEAAEAYKIKYGRLGKDKTRQRSSVVNSDIDLRELNKVIQLRQDEIILNVLHQIQESGYAGQLDSGIVLIGGASQMNGLTEYLADKAQLPVKRGTVKRVYINNVAELLQNPAYTQSLGILLYANENCEKKEEPQPIEFSVTTASQQPEPEPEVVEQPRSKKKKKNKEDAKQGKLFGFLERIQNFGGAMFDEDE